MSYPAFPQYSSVDYSKKKERRGNSSVFTECTEPHITENSEPQITESTELHNVSSSMEVKSQKYIDVEICNPNQAVQESAIAEVDAVGLNCSEEDDNAINGAEVEISLHVLEEKPPMNVSPYMPISAETLDSNIAVRNTTQRYEKAAPKVSSHSFRKMLVTALLMNIVLCLIVCGILGYVLYDLHQLKLKFLSQNFSCLQSVTETETGTVSKSCFNVSECLNAAGSINLFYSHLHDSHVSKARLERYTNGIAFSVNSCSSFKHLSVKSPSGYYWLSAQNGSPVNVYCDMDLSCGGIRGGWTRLVKWDRTEPDVKFPCNRIDFSDYGLHHSKSTNVSIKFPLRNNFQYSKVCGRIKVNSTGISGGFTIGSVSFTYGMPNRSHIWTFAALTGDINKNICRNLNIVLQEPEFVGSDLFYGIVSSNVSDSSLHWMKCDPPETYASTDTSPWFFKDLHKTTPYPVEMQIFGDAMAIETVELYVQ